MSQSADPYPWRPEAVRQLRAQGRNEDAEAILQQRFLWQPEWKTVEQWMALGAYLTAAASGED